MSESVNKVVLVGNLGRDPEERSTQSGSKIVNLTLATSESWTDKQTGEKQSRTEWHKVVIFNDALGGIAMRFLHKGSKVYIEGMNRTRKWTDQQGIERYTTEVTIERFKGDLVLLGSKADGDGYTSQPAQRPQATNQTYGSNRSMSDAAGYGDNPRQSRSTPQQSASG